jgi:2-oxoisovalerate dehydrogenase E1 component
VLAADPIHIKNGESCVVVTYGMGVYWSLAAAKTFKGKIEIIDLRTLFPLDEEMIFTAVKTHGKCLIVCEEQQYNSFSEALAARIMQHCFPWLDAPVQVLGALPLPAVPIQINLEREMLPSAEKVAQQLACLLDQ